MTFHITTLGCKVNSCESAAIHAAFTAAGYTPAGDDAPADVYIINSCAVTGTGVKKARQTVSHCKALNPDGVTVLCGCGYCRTFLFGGVYAAQRTNMTGLQNAQLTGQTFCFVIGSLFTSDTVK